ncbi:hypothetical protein [Paraburkholderia humisilvae]|uniref:hypothetical protein n=1 Tax=Paraburkholderia humisilvae TaxID=627669 RepID=UPI0015836DC8|nr:hypothetical protein [Paraburkholderia humisilvae]
MKSCESLRQALVISRELVNEVQAADAALDRQAVRQRHEAFFAPRLDHRNSILCRDLSKLLAGTYLKTANATLTVRPMAAYVLRTRSPTCSRFCSLVGVTFVSELATLQLSLFWRKLAREL